MTSKGRVTVLKIKRFISVPIVILTLFVAFVEYLYLSMLVSGLKDLKVCTYKTTATIERIEQPGSKLHVSCYDENSVFHDSVFICNGVAFEIFPKEPLRGTEMEIYLNEEGTFAVAIYAFYCNMAMSIAIPVIYILFMIWRYKRIKKLRSNK